MRDISVRVINGQTLTKTEIKHWAQATLMEYGPDVLDDCGTELVTRTCPTPVIGPDTVCIRQGDLEEHPQYREIMDEVAKQGDRIRKLFGYETKWS